MIVDARPELGKMFSDLDEELKALRSLQRNIFDQKDRAERRRFGGEYFEY